MAYFLGWAGSVLLTDVLGEALSVAAVSADSASAAAGSAVGAGGPCRGVWGCVVGGALPRPKVAPVAAVYTGQRWSVVSTFVAVAASSSAVAPSA